MQKAIPTVQVDNDRTRVTQWRFEPGAATGYHRHEYDYVIVPQTSGQMPKCFLPPSSGLHCLSVKNSQTVTLRVVFS